MTNRLTPHSTYCKAAPIKVQSVFFPATSQCSTWKQVQKLKPKVTASKKAHTPSSETQKGYIYY